MDVKTLERANELLKKIKQLQSVLEIFEWESGFGFSMNLKLIIEFDRHGREEKLFPIDLNNELLNILKVEITRVHDTAVAELEQL